MRLAGIFLTFLITSSNLVYSQAPTAFSYQAIMRNSDGELISDQNISIRASLRQSVAEGAIVYSEKHELSTNENGLISIQIGLGEILQGGLTTIDWADGPYFLEISVDPAGGNSFTSLGSTQLLSVPFALYANESPQKWQQGDDNIFVLNENVGIGLENPSQKLTIDGKVKIGNDSLEAEEGVLRYNSEKKDIEAYVDDAYRSVTKMQGLNFETAGLLTGFTGNIRNFLVSTNAKIEIEETGLYAIYMQCYISNLSGNTNTLPSDRNVNLQLMSVRNGNVNTVAFATKTAHFDALPSGAVAYGFRNTETLQDFVVTEIFADTSLELFIAVQTNGIEPDPTTNYTVGNIKLYTIKIQ